jgi:hypothetical protein
MDVVFVDNNGVLTGLLFALISINSVANAGSSAAGQGSLPSASSAPVPSDAFDAARQKLSDAHNEFYRAAKKPGISSQEMVRLRNQILRPAQENMDNAILQEKIKTVRKYTRPGGVAQKGAGQGEVQKIEQPSEPDLQLDGSGIKKEVEFKSSKAKKK